MYVSPYCLFRTFESPPYLSASLSSFHATWLAAASQVADMASHVEEQSLQFILSQHEWSQKEWSKLVEQISELFGEEEA